MVKRGWKVFWMICIVLACAGVGMSIAGLALGADFASIQKTYEPDIKTHYSTDDIVNEYLEGAYQNVTELEVDVTNCQVVIRPVDGLEGIQVDTANLNHDAQLRVEQDDEKLEISSERHHMGHKSQGVLYVNIPRGMLFQDVELKVGAGTLETAELNAQQIEVSVGAGKAVMEDCAASEFSAECGAGQIQAGFAGIKTDYNYDLECAMGNISVDQDNFSGVAMDKKIDNGATKNIKAECGAGEIRFTFGEKL